jgi:hypothetical protein
MNQDNVIHSLHLEPGKTIESLKGEIISVHFSQWGTYGKVKVENKIYNYKLKNTEFARSVIVGLDLFIENGFCIKNKKGEIIVTEGKFGNANTELNINRYYKKEDDNRSKLTGIVKSFDEQSLESVVRIALFLPPNKESQFIITQKTEEFKKKSNDRQITIGSIIRADVEKNETDLLAKSIEILPENHFWHILLRSKENPNKHVSGLFQIMIKKMEIVDSFYDVFKDILFNVGKDVSKTSLVTLRDLLHSKIFNGELVFPYNILIPDHLIREYFDNMIDFCREYIYLDKNINNPENILLLIRNFYPEYKLKDIF